MHAECWQSLHSPSSAARQAADPRSRTQLCWAGDVKRLIKELDRVMKG